jgi:hypothetical protein
MIHIFILNKTLIGYIMKNLLAENMLRFGVKNLTESQLSKIQLLMEQGAQTTSYTLPEVVGLDDLKTNEISASVYTYFSNAIKNYGLLFPDDMADPAVWMTLGYIIGSAYSRKAIFQQLRRGVNIIEVLNRTRRQGNQSPMERFGVPASSEKEIIQLNQHPTDKGKVITVGQVGSKTGASSNNPGESSNYFEILKFLNDQNLKLYLYTGNTLSIDNDSDNDFIAGDPGSTGGAGSLNLHSDARDFEGGDSSGMYFYGTINYAPASGQTKAETKIITKFTPGEEISPELGKLFPTGKIQLAAGKDKEIAQAVEDAKKLGKLLKIRIESSASADRGTTMSREEFAKMVGLPLNQVPADPSVNNKSDNVTDPMEGGNAFLTIKRAQVAANAIKSVTNIQPQITAKIQDGGDAAQYVKLFMTVQKEDQTTTWTEEEITNAGTGATRVDVKDKFQMIKVDLT